MGAGVILWVGATVLGCGVVGMDVVGAAVMGGAVVGGAVATTGASIVGGDVTGAGDRTGVAGGEVVVIILFVLMGEIVVETKPLSAGTGVASSRRSASVALESVTVVVLPFAFTVSTGASEVGVVLTGCAVLGAAVAGGCVGRGVGKGVGDGVGITVTGDAVAMVSGNGVVMELHTHCK